MSVGARSTFTEPFADLCFPVHRVRSAYCYRCPVGKTRATCDIDCVDSLERLLEKEHKQIAAVIVEPLLQGAGGMIVHPVEFLERVRRLCTEYDVLLIADEVLTGFGRAGRMFACELAGTVPDLMCLSKGITGGVLPLGATVATERIHQAFVSTGHFEDRSFHGHSYSGNPIAAAAAVARTLEFSKANRSLQRSSEHRSHSHREAGCDCGIIRRSGRHSLHPSVECR